MLNYIKNLSNLVGFLYSFFREDVLNMKIAIIGGVAAGTSAAAKASRENEDAEIVIFEKGEDISYAGCGLPYYISDVIQNRDKLVINTPEEFANKYGVDVKNKHEVLAINPDKKSLRYKDLESGQKGVYKYDKLIITTGASPVIPPITGIELNNILPLRTVDDADLIKDKISDKDNSHVTVVGAGLIGLEMTEALREAGLEVTIIEKLPAVLPLIANDMSKIIQKHLLDKGVELILDDGVDKFVGNDKVNKVITESGKKINTDLVLMSIGVKPNVSLAKKAGLEIGDTGAIAVNKRMETSIKDIYSAGDCVETRHILSDEFVWVPLASTANKQGRIVGINVTGGQEEHKGILGTAITKVFDLTVATSGLSTVEAENNGFTPVTVIIKGANHPHYYPDQEKINIKGVFDRESGRILGATVIGGEGADKRIDVLITAISNGMTADELFQLDLAYAPPYSTPKDVVNVLGMVAKKKL